jgi:hypothetical protein
VLFDAREEIGQLVRDSLKFGTVIPANMKPWIDHLFETGNLLDEQGNKIEDIAGLKYGEAMETEAEVARKGWEKILAKIQGSTTTVSSSARTCSRRDRCSRRCSPVGSA